MPGGPGGASISVIPRLSVWEKTPTINVTNFVTPGDISIWNDTWIARDSTAYLNVDLGAVYRLGGVGKGVYTVLYSDITANPGNASGLASGQQGVTKSGVTKIVLPAASHPGGPTMSNLTRKVLSGLVPGHTYRIEITFAIVGYQNAGVTAGLVGAMAISKSCSLPGADVFDQILATYEGGNVYEIILVNNQGVPTDLMKLGQITASSDPSGLGYIAINPIGTKAVHCNYDDAGGASVDIIDIATMTKTRVAAPASRTNPYSIVWHPTNTDLCYVGFTGTSKRVIPLTISTATWGTEATVVGLPLRMVMLPDASKIYVIDQTSNLERINVSAGVLGTVATITNAHAGVALMPTADSSKVYVVNSDKTIQTITTSSEAISATTALDATPVPQDAAMMPDEHSIHVTGDNGRSYHYNLNSPGVTDFTKYTDWALDARTNAPIVISSNGDLFYGKVTSGVNEFYGGSMDLQQGAGSGVGPVGNVLHVAIEGAS